MNNWMKSTSEGKTEHHMDKQTDKCQSPSKHKNTGFSLQNRTAVQQDEY